MPTAANIAKRPLLPSRKWSGADLAVPIWRSGFLIDLARSGACRSGGFRPIWHGAKFNDECCIDSIWLLLRSGDLASFAIWRSGIPIDLAGGKSYILLCPVNSHFFELFEGDKSPLVPVRIAITSVFDETLRYNHHFSHRFRFSHLEPPNPTFPKPIFFNKNLPPNAFLHKKNFKQQKRNDRGRCNLG